MNSPHSAQIQVMMAARDQGISSVLFRNAAGRKLGLNVTDYECLSFLSIKNTATPTELARYTGLTTGSTTVMLDRLEKAGFIKRLPNPQDRRGVLVQLTSKWQEVAAPLAADMHMAHQELLSGYTEIELAVIADFLVRFSKNVNDQVEKINKGVK